jgi:selenocysteine lyase/cysteine desulfurase
MAPDWAAIRAQFPALESWTFLNTATFGQLPVRATQAVSGHFAHRDAAACMDFLDWFADHDRLRGSIGQLIHADADSIAFVPNASSGLSLLLGGIDWKPGDQILTLEQEFPNNLYYPAMLAERGVELVEVTWDRLYDSVTGRTRLVVVSMLSYVNGIRPPLAQLAKFLRDRNVLLYVDGTQGLGALELNITEVQPDVLSVHGYKWMLAPNGAGFLYVAPHVRKWLRPNVVGWRSHKDWRNVDMLHHGTPELTGAAEKYEGAMLPSALLYAMEQSVELMLEIGPAEIQKRVLDLAAKTREILRDLGAGVQSGELFDSPIVAGRFDGSDASLLARELKSRRVLVSARHGNLRVSTHFYNSENDLDRLREELQRVL